MRNLLITGATHNDRFLHAINLARTYLSCEPQENSKIFLNPNLIIVGPEGLDLNNDRQEENYCEIKLDQVFKIIQENQKSNFNKGIAIYLITHAHHLTKQAANALLKTIEENNKDKFIIALAPSRSSVLPTIASRLIQKRLKPIFINDEINPDIIDLLFNITKTQPHLRISFIDNFSQEKNELRKQLQELLHGLHVLLMQKIDKKLSFMESFLIGKAILEAQAPIRRNVNIKLIIEEMLFNKWPFFAKEDLVGRKL